jgi:hypothetical protein
MLHRLLPPIAALFIALLGTTAQAQTVGGDWPTTHALQSTAAGFAHAVCKLGDLNADGVTDFAIGLPYLSTIGGTEAGAVQFFSGQTGLLLRTAYGSSAFGHFGQALAGLGDLNGDGIHDYLIAAPQEEKNGMLQAGAVWVFSGADGSQILHVDGTSSHGLFGFSVAGAGDLDGDQIEDFLVGAPGSSPNSNLGAGAAGVYSGSTGALLKTYFGAAAGDAFGYSVASAGDVNNDNFPDILIGAAATDVNFRSNCGSAYVYSGFNGNLLWHTDGANSDDYLGHAVAGAGDLNGDGYAEVILGAPGSDPQNLAFAGSAFVYSGATGSLLFRLDGVHATESLGAAVANAGDVDGDTINDILLGAPDANFQTGYAAIFSGVDGHLLHRRADAPWPSQLGFAVCGLGDLNGDGRAEVLIAAPHTMPLALGDGYVFIYGFDPYLTSNRSALSASLGGSVVFTLDFPIAFGNQRFRLLATNHGLGSTLLGGIQIPLVASGPVWDAMSAATPPAIFTQASGSLNSDGDASSMLNLPAGVASVLLNTDIHFSAFVFQPPTSGLASSAAVVLHLLP